MLAHSFLIKSSSKLLVTRTGIKARMSLILGLWFPWPIYMFFEMRFDLGTLDSGERSLPFGLLVLVLSWGGSVKGTLLRAWGVDYFHVSHVMRKLVFAICKWQRCLCCLLHRLYNISSFYFRNFRPLAGLCGCAVLFESYLVENPEDRFSRDEAHVFSVMLRFCFAGTLLKLLAYMQIQMHCYIKDPKFSDRQVLANTV